MSRTEAENSVPVSLECHSRALSLIGPFIHGYYSMVRRLTDSEATTTTEASSLSDSAEESHLGPVRIIVGSSGTYSVPGHRVAPGVRVSALCVLRSYQVQPEARRGTLHTSVILVVAAAFFKFLRLRLLDRRI